jgi:hypothetical protein
MVPHLRVFNNQPYEKYAFFVSELMKWCQKCRDRRFRSQRRWSVDFLAQIFSTIDNMLVVAFICSRRTYKDNHSSKVKPETSDFCMTLRIR